ncbi:hypothetical protein GF356_00415 [candidate division GN15 bacterium]|nr:hypothetical protein [candidate division GN15 bacterium]
MKYELQSIGLWSAFKILFLFNLIAGFVVGLIYALLFSFIMTIASQMPGMPIQQFQSMGTSTGALVIIMPIMFSLGSAVFNTILGFIAALLYNALARLIGGLELDLQVASPEHAEMSSTRPTSVGPAGHAATAPGAPPHQHTPPPPPPAQPQQQPPEPPQEQPPPADRDDDNRPNQPT